MVINKIQNNILFNIYNLRIIIYCFVLIDCQILIDDEFGYETPKKSKSSHATNNLKIKIGKNKCALNVNSTSKTLKSDKYETTEQKLLKTPKVLRKQIAKGYLVFNYLLNINNFNVINVFRNSASKI